MNSMTLLFLLLALCLGIFVYFYNRLVAQKNMVEEAWSGIDVQLKRRHDLIPNLVRIVQGYASYEEDTLTSVIQARTSSVSNQATAETEVSRKLGKLFALVEQYPDLKADSSFRKLHESLIEIEDSLQYARRYYNGSVRDLNILVESFPSRLVASLAKISSAEFFEIELVTERGLPDITL